MKDGGPAFPGGFVLDDKYAMTADGMTLRDYFAAQALRENFAALASAGWENFNEFQLERCAKAAYAAADAMLAERSK